MAKKKDSTALFEVISRSRQRRSEAGLSVPTWMGHDGADTEVPRDAAMPEAPDAGTPLPESMVSTEGGRLRLSLNYVSCMVGALTIVLLLVLSFCLGRWGILPLSKGEPASTVEKRLEARTQLPLPLQEIRRVPGKHYLVIQGMQGMSTQHLDDAIDIVNFLATNGIRADVAEYRGNPRQYIVCSGREFDSPNSEAAERYIRTIELLGRRYKAQSRMQRKYEFRDPWFLTWPEPWQRDAGE